jgi:hypothetical protein
MQNNTVPAHLLIKEVVKMCEQTYKHLICGNVSEPNVCARPQPQPQDGGYGSHLGVCFRRLTQERLWRINHKLFCWFC